MRPPRITPGWVAGGWELEQAHVPGSRRMLGIWALSGVGALVVTNVGAWLGDLHAGMYAGAGLGTAGILAGAAVYRRCERSFRLPGREDAWWLSDEHQPVHVVEGVRGRQPREHVLAAAEMPRRAR